MKLLNALSLGAAILSASVSFAAAETFTKGSIKKIDEKAGKVTIIHEELVDLGMPAMTMVFKLANADMLKQLAVGKDVEFVADRVQGKLTVVKLK
jgi:Cu/Ag efflux protein CusF